MPYHVVHKVTDALNRQRKSVNGSRILILGVAYKKDVNDVRESPALDIIKLLQEKGALVHYSDPYVPELMVDGKPLTSVNISGYLHPSSSRTTRGKKPPLTSYDCILIVTDHSLFDYQAIVKAANLVVDTRNATRHIKTDPAKIVKL
jgi:UDP-N-acetyl-D-glucosamine dehydrogenase